MKAYIRKWLRFVLGFLLSFKAVLKFAHKCSNIVPNLFFLYFEGTWLSGHTCWASNLNVEVWAPPHLVTTPCVVSLDKTLHLHCLSPLSCNGYGLTLGIHLWWTNVLPGGVNDSHQYGKNATLEINTGHMRLISLFMFIYDI